MNTKALKQMGATIGLLAGLGVAPPALATSTGVQALGAGSEGTGNTIDVWTFTCPASTVSAQARVFDDFGLLAGNNLTVVLGEDGAPTVQATDLSPGIPLPGPAHIPRGDSPGGSLFAVAADGPGTYAMAFIKSGLGAEGYTGEAQCVRAPPFPVFNPVLRRRINQ